MNVRSPEERFWEKVNIPDDRNLCWLWTACVNPAGYGVFALSRTKQTIASRYSYLLNTGSIPKDMFILHKCDNPPCVNPEHLFVGTQKDNMMDKVNKGRGTKGEQVGSSKLLEKEVLEIKNSFKDNPVFGAQIKLARTYKVDVKTIQRILTNQIWKHV